MKDHCCVKNCGKRRKDGVSLFSFPWKREDHLKEWLKNIPNFKPQNSDVICSDHFQEKDFMSKRGKNGVLLKYSAVPSIFPNMPENEILQISTVPEHSRSILKKKSILMTPQRSFVPEDSTVNHQNILPNNREKQREISSRFPALQMSPAPEDTIVNHPTTSDVCEILAAPEDIIVNHLNTFSVQENPNANILINMEDAPPVKKKRIMSSSTFHFKQQELTPRKKKMQKRIRALEQQVIRREKKIVILQDLLKQLR